ncbi:MAG: YdcF family protein [Phycisphaerae bacterium]|nr:YdcF family protein [Gemmatimonadaceae bacterium]
MGFTAFMVADVLGLTDVTGSSPIVCGVFALAAGALLAPSRFGVVLWMCTFALAVVAAAVSYTPLVRAPARHFVRTDGDDAPVDAVIVLSGSMTEDGLLTREVLVRLTSGIAEARRRGVRTVALSVITQGTGSRGPISSEPDQLRLMRQLAPELEVMLVRGVHSTRDEALQFAALGRTHGWQRIAVVTSPMHTRRACRTFEVAGVPVSCVPAESREYSLRWLGGAHARLSVFRNVLYETLGTLWYSARGWV